MDARSARRTCSKRAAAGTAHLLYTRSPGGVAVTAERVARFRTPVERAAKAAGVNPDRLEALVFLESAGRPEAQAPGGVASATGLTQILAETATGLLGMKVDQAKSRELHAAAEHGAAPGQPRRARRRLNRARRRVDDRFDPAKALAGTARYLKLARERFGREDLAFVSYHMGIGNLENVLKAFGGGRRSYAELYFDSTPLRHPKAYAKLAGFGDDSSNYYWKLSAAMEIMRMARRDKDRLIRLAALQTADDSARARAARRRADRRLARAARRRRGHVADDRAAGLAAARGARRRALRRRPGADDLQGARAARDRRRRRRLDVPRSRASTPPTTRRRHSSTFSIACKFST